MPPKRSQGPDVPNPANSLLRAARYKPQEFNNITKGIAALEGLQKIQGKNAILAKVLSDEYLKFNTRMNMGARQMLTLSNAFKDIKISTNTYKGIGEKTLTPIYAAIANLIKPSKGAAKAMQFLPPEFTQIFTSMTNLSKGLVGLYALVAVIDILKRAIVGAVQDTFTSMKSLSGGLGWQNVTWRDSARFAAGAAIATAQYGIKLDEITGLTTALTDASTMNALEMERMGDSWAATVAESGGTFLALAKVMGLTNAQAASLANTLIMMGNQAVGKLPADFMEFQRSVKVSRLNVGALSEVLNNLAPVSMAVKQPMYGMVGVLGALQIRFKKSTDEITTFIRESGRTKLMTDALISFSRAAAGLQLPELMAFGGGMRPGVDPWEAISAGIEQGREKTMLNYLQKVAESTGGTLNQQKFAIMKTLMDKNVTNETQARELAENIGNSTQQQITKEGNTAQALIKAQDGNAKAIATLSAVLEDPMEKIAKLIEAGLLIMVSGINLFNPGAGSDIYARVNRGAQGPKGSFGAASPEGNMNG